MIKNKKSVNIRTKSILSAYFCFVFPQDDVTYQVINRESELCITSSTGKVWLEKCDSNSLRQKWRWN